MKGITYCGACADYDIKKHCCKRGAKLESNPQDKFFDDCPLPDVEPVRHGRWKPLFESEITGWNPAFAGCDPIGAYVCSCCNSEATYTCDDEFDLSNYCPNCGAKMDLEEDTCEMRFMPPV